MRYLYLAALLAFPAVADEARDRAIRVTGMHMISAHMCAGVTGDWDAYRIAVAEAPETLQAAGIGESEAQAIVSETRAKIEARDQSGDDMDAFACKLVVGAIAKNLPETRAAIRAIP